MALVGLVGLTRSRSRRRGVASPPRNGTRAGWTDGPGWCVAPVVVGLQLVDVPGRGRLGVRTAVVGTALALAGVCAVMVVASSLGDHAGRAGALRVGLVGQTGPGQ